jgi:ATP-dependent Lon protease
MNPQVAEYSIQRNYLDLFLDLPWNYFSEDNFDLKRAQKNIREGPLWSR